ncbi:DUF3382 domain-containing protein, partial [Escherichia coli]
YRTDLSQTSALDLTPRWGLVAAFCAAAFALRVAQRLWLARREARRSAAVLPKGTDGRVAVARRRPSL